MATNTNNVLRQIEPLTEEDFHAAFAVSLSTMIQKHGKGRVAEWLGTSTKMVDNYFAGSLPAPHRLFNLQLHDDDALDAIDREYGTRRVPRGAICSTDPVSTKLAQLLSRTIDIERPDSEGGEDATLAELLLLPEDVLRACSNKLAGWVERIDTYRHGKPRSVAA